MTTTTLISAVSVGASATAVSNITKHTFATTSGAFNLQADLTAGTLPSDSCVVIHYAPLMDNFTANAAAVEAAGKASFLFEVDARKATAQRYRTTDMEGCRGRYLLVWIEEPLLNATATLTVKVTEY